MASSSGYPIAVQLDEGKRHDLYACKQVVKEIPRGSEVTADMGYDALWFRAYLEQKGIYPNIARRSFSRQGQRGHTTKLPIPGSPPPNPLTYRNRYAVERLFSWMEKFKRLQVRRERLAFLFEAFWQLGCAYLILNKFMR